MAINLGKQPVVAPAVNTLTPKSIAAFKGAKEYFLNVRKEAQDRITEIDKLMISLENERERLYDLLDATRFKGGK